MPPIRWAACHKLASTRCQAIVARTTRPLRASCVNVARAGQVMGLL